MKFVSIMVATLCAAMLATSACAQGSYGSSGGYTTAHTHRHVVRHYSSGSTGGTWLRPRLFNRYAEGPAIVQGTPVRSAVRSAATIVSQPVRSARTVLRRVCGAGGCRLVEVQVEDDEAVESATESAAPATKPDPPAATEQSPTSKTNALPAVELAAANHRPLHHRKQ